MTRLMDWYTRRIAVGTLYIQHNTETVLVPEAAAALMAMRADMAVIIARSLTHRP